MRKVSFIIIVCIHKLLFSVILFNSLGVDIRAENWKAVGIIQVNVQMLDNCYGSDQAGS